MADWRLKPRAQRCAACGAPFAPGCGGHSLLMPAADGEGHERRDLCAACFAALGARERALASAAWAFTVPQAVPRRAPEEAHKVSPEEALRALVGRADPRDGAATYVLALLLERGKRLAERQVARDAAGRRVHLYELRGTGELISVAEPALDAEALPGIQRRVAELLAFGVRPRPCVRRFRRARRPAYRVKRRRG